MAVIVKDLGIASAYGYAKSKGYTGTEEEFAELMASYADVAQQAEAAAQDAEDAKDEAVTAKTDAQTAKTAAQAAQSASETASGAASTKASEAAQSAQAASGSATAAQTSATAAAGSAQTAQAAAQTATTKASEASSSASAASTAKTGAETARTGAQTAQTAAETAQENAEAAAASVSASAAQIEQNTADIGAIKNDLSEKSIAEIPCAISPMGDKADLSLSGYSGKKVFISNKNLLPQFTAMTNNGVTCTKNADGSISLSGTANGVAVITITGNEMPNLGSGTYALSCGNSVAMGDSNTYINVAIDGSYAAIYARFNAVDGKTIFTVPEGSAVTTIRIRISSGTVVPEGFTCYPQIVEGSEFIDFIPHKGSILNPTSGTITGVEVYDGYTYICAQSGVSGTVTYDISRIDDIETRVEALEQRSSKFEGKKIVCFGDSLVGNFPAPTDYPSMIAELTGATVYNAGFGGCCMSDNGQTRKDFTMCRLADSIVAGDFSAQRNSGVSITYAGTSTDYVPERLTMLENIDWSDIDYIIIAYGTNDWNSNYGLDNDSNLLDTTTYIGAFRYSVEKLLAEYPQLKILVITPLWRWWDTNTGMPTEIQADYIDSNDYAKGTGYKLWQYGDALETAAKLYHIPVFNIYWDCMMTKQNRLQYFNANDGTHPKLEGRVLMSEMISAALGSCY